MSDALIGAYGYDAIANTSYTWTIPDASAIQGLIKVEGFDFTGAALASVVSAAFTIVGTAACPLLISSPTNDDGQESSAGHAEGNDYDPAAARENSPDINTDKSLPLYLGVPACRSGSLLRGTTFPAVYYCGADGKRYVFPSDEVYFSWYEDFSEVVTVSDDALIDSPLGGNVTYRPGIRLVKIQTDPKTYAVARGGMLRWVQDEAAAARLFGVEWNKRIDDVLDAYFVNYSVGSPIAR